MNLQPDDFAALDVEELSSFCGLSVAELHEVLEYGAVASAVPAGPFRCGPDYLTPLREAARLRDIFDLDLFTVSLLVGYLHRIDALERQLKSLHAHIQRQAPSREGPATWREPHA